MSAGISLVVPTYNMAQHLAGLWESLRGVGLFDVLDEVVFVDDGSTDQTRAELERLQALPTPAGHAAVRIVSLPQNKGRYEARFIGAQEAQSERILFLDSRLTLPPNFGANLARAAQKSRGVMGIVDIDINRNAFCLYWDRSHRRIFWRHYRDTQQPLLLTAENYDRYLKGTTVYLCSREAFLAACKKFEGQGLLSDDTFLLKEIVQTEPILIDPSVRINWVPREDTRTFLARLWERGPSFVEYHVFERQGPFFFVVMLGLLVLAAWLVLLLTKPADAVTLALLSVAVAALSTGVFARSVGEFFRLAPLHTAVVVVWSGAILRGLWFNLRRKMRKEPGLSIDANQRS